jgi:hypothetical protein
MLHVLLGPLLWKEDCWLPFPSKGKASLVPNYYVGTYTGPSTEAPETDALQKPAPNQVPASGEELSIEKIDHIASPTDLDEEQVRREEAKKT